ncbi:hypothetical protein SAMN06265222_11811 [Neorhodopirellula lusitana]|uniref:Transposase n=1 Tax=Neorhodopirellula lusitana TaxID=445327 RepID=A0ABY1QPY3_9BACT|nr:hypothetical protein SAMN06265222_11811 [Neorhodopirellula lusitana]
MTARTGFRSIHAKRQQTRFIKDLLSLKATYLKTARALLMHLAHLSDRFGHRPDEPRNI